MRSDYCKLSWDAPEDDGGTSITQYTVTMMDLSVNQWVTAAETKDRSAGIQGLKPGHLYRYRESFSSFISSLVILNLNPLQV